MLYLKKLFFFYTDDIIGSIKCSHWCYVYTGWAWVNIGMTNIGTGRDFSIKASTQVLVVVTQTNNVRPWIMLSLENGFHTDTSWKYHQNAPSGDNWWTTDFDDSTWDNASVNEAIAGLIESPLAVRLSQAITGVADATVDFVGYDIFRGKLHAIPGKYSFLLCLVLH